MQGYLKTTLLLLCTWSSIVFANENQGINHQLGSRFIYFQGFASCTRPHYQPLYDYYERVDQIRQAGTQSIDSRSYWYCFDMGVYEHPSDSTERLYWQASDANGEWSDLAEVHPIEAPSLLVSDLEEQAREFAAQGGQLPLKVFIAGHSHGGWLAMRTAAALGTSPLLKVEHLLTIDPISYRLCESSWFILNILENTGQIIFGGEPDDCHQAPRDLASLGPAIHQSTQNSWSNFYQSTMPYLRSGPAPYATWNIDFPWNSTTDAWTGHIAILRDPRTWTGFWDRVSRAITTNSN